MTKSRSLFLFYYFAGDVTGQTDAFTDDGITDTTTGVGDDVTSVTMPRTNVGITDGETTAAATTTPVTTGHLTTHPTTTTTTTHQPANTATQPRPTGTLTLIFTKFVIYISNCIHEHSAWGEGLFEFEFAQGNITKGFQKHFKFKRKPDPPHY